MSLAEVDLGQLLGADAAEDETDARLAEYFLRTPAYGEVANPTRRLRVIVGSKGTGKSAMFRVAAGADREKGRLPIEVRPDDVSDVAQGALTYLQLVAAWKTGLSEVLVEKSLEALGTNGMGSGTKRSSLILDAIAEALSGDESGFDPQPPASHAVASFRATRELTLYLDDLDRGWTGTRADAQRYGAMFDALRDLQRENQTLRVRVGLRTDLFAAIRANDASSDKWQSAVVHHTWSNHETFVLLVKRVLTYFGDVDYDFDSLLHRPQRSSAHLLDPILSRRFGGTGLWSNKPMYNVIMSFARRRPRDLVVLLNLAGGRAQQRRHTVIETDDLVSSFPQFSEGRLTDTVNEFGLEAMGLDRFLLAMKPSKVERTAAENYLLSTDAALTRIRRALDQAPLRFASGRESSPMEALAFLYRIDFLLARRTTEEGFVDRKYYDQRQLLTPDKLDFGYGWEIHLAFRWALQPDERDIFRHVPPDSTD